ncbi:peptidoglycan-binding protein [Streptomyces noursei]|uniref:peptidoglycan-binding domain-containing protein n=1 Tax=Streptomyces noursei TaxID=1971 RepID=UPI00364345A0
MWWSGRAGTVALVALTALTSVTACHPVRITPALRPGAHGPAVRDLQARLAQLALFPHDPTGRYGAGTARAVRTFQQEAGLSVTGTYASADRSALTSRTRRPTHTELHHTGKIRDRSDN